MPFPKTTGPELFNVGFVKNAQKRSSTTDMRVEDLLATLTPVQRWNTIGGDSIGGEEKRNLKSTQWWRNS